MKDYLFVYSLSPVQSFISQARKTKDLYAGSKILSVLVDNLIYKLSKIVINEYKSDFELIFPNKDDINIKNERNEDTKVANTPNRFFCILKGFKKEDITAIGQKLEGETTRILLNWSESVLKEYDLHMEDLFKEQIANYFHVYWSSVDIPNDAYIRRYLALEADLGAIKNIRTFEQQIKSHHKKCTVCAQHVGLFYSAKGRIQRRSNISQTYPPLKDHKHGILAGDELLCSLCFMKRNLDNFIKKEDFPSTAEIALQTTLDKIKKKNTKKLQKYREIFGTEFEDMFYFKDTLTENNLQRYGIDINRLKEIKEAHDELTEIKDKTENTELKEKIKFRKYYAIIRFDGDDMGKKLSGHYLKDKSQLKAFHQEMSSVLGEFAEEISAIFDDTKGSLVYAGGDDVLAFCPIDQLIPNLKLLYEKFKEKVNSPSFKKNYKIDDSFTASCGVCIAHYRTPLSVVLKWSHIMEKEQAKQVKNKNAFAIATLKHSGEIRFFKYKFTYAELSNNQITLDLTKNILDLLSQGVFSTNFIRDFQANYSSLSVSKDADLVEPLLKRSLSRSMKKEEIKNSTLAKESKNIKNDELLQKIIEDTLESLISLYKNSTTTTNFVSFLDFLMFYSKEV